MTPEIVKAWKALWESNGSLTALVPGGLHHRRAEQGTASPYATITVEEGEPAFTTGTAFIQPFSVMIRVYAGSELANASTIKRTMGLTFVDEDRQYLRIERATVMHLLPMTGTVEHAENTLNAQDVLVAALNWNLLLQLER